MTSRTIERIVVGQPTSDGAGVKLTRVLTQDLQRRLDPFLMLDAFRNENPDDYMGGFPDHPHRGFETVTYMLAGRMRHHDSAGNAGLLEGGGAQWMTAGRGLVHSEMPEQENGLMEGFQLWVNLPGKNKMIAPIYQDLLPAQIAEYRVNQHLTVRAIAGEVQLTHAAGTTAFAGTVKRPDTEPIFLDLHFSQAGYVEVGLPAGHNVLVYTYRGEVMLGSEVSQQALPDQRMAILTNGSGQTCVRVSAEHAARCILVAGKPLAEPIVQYGPFVMNTREQIIQAFTDFEAGRIRA
jgi:quercetin 2,3-dioxygenase